MNFLANWKTTLAGVALIGGAIADIATQASTGTWDGNRLMADFTAFTGGWGLVFSKDANVTGGTKQQ